MWFILNESPLSFQINEKNTDQADVSCSALYLQPDVGFTKPHVGVKTEPRALLRESPATWPYGFNLGVG